MPVSLKRTLNIERCGWVISLITCPFQWPAVSWTGRSESPEDAAVQPCNSLLFIRGCGRTRRHLGVVFYLGRSDSWGHTANLLSGSYQVHRSGWYCKVERSWELANCVFSVWLGKRVCLLQLPPYFQSKTVVVCRGNFSCWKTYSKDWSKANNLGVQREADFSPPPPHSLHGAVQACYLPM